MGHFSCFGHLVATFCHFFGLEVFAYPVLPPPFCGSSVTFSQPFCHFFGHFLGCGFFAYSWKLPTYSGAFLLTIDNFSFFTYSWSFLAYSFSFLLTVGAFLLTVRKCV